MTANSPVFAGVQIVTGHDGMVPIIFDDAAQTRLDAGRESNITLTEDIYQGTLPEDVSQVSAQVEEIQQALLTGQVDPTAMLEATAAGGGVEGGGGGHAYTKFCLDGMQVTPDAGAETRGVGYNFLDPEAHMRE